jgi:hypothetical protein
VSLRAMTRAEIAAMRDLEAAEIAVSNAVLAREAARERLTDTMRRERRREQAREHPPHLQLVAGTRPRAQPAQPPERQARIHHGDGSL